MTAYTDDILEFLGDNAAFQSWATDMHNLIVAAGWVQTADTGQVDVTTAALPAINVYAGYRIYRFNDSLQATSPIFVKVEYGVTSPSNRAQMRLIFGTGSNGAGTITNPSTTQVLTQSATGVAGATRPAYASANPGCAVLWSGYVTGGTTGLQVMAFGVERWRNADGTLNGDGWSYVVSSAGSCTDQTYRVVTNSWRISRAHFTGLPLVHGSSGVEGVDVAVHPHVPIHGLARPPGLMFVVFYLADISGGTVFSVTRYGVVRTYRALGLSVPQWNSNQATPVGPAMIYD